jgi:TolB-like protein/Tfp pilus assembly protein PilF
MLFFCAIPAMVWQMSAPGESGLFQELKRRNVFRVAIAYVIVAWLIMQVVDLLVPILTLPDWVPRLVFLLLLIGFPLALLFAWAFELTPEGVRLEKQVNPDDSIAGNTGRKLDFVIIGVLVIALGFSMYVNFQNEGDEVRVDSSVAEVTETVGRASIAVLPFANRSANEDDVFFVDGMHDDLLTHLANISSLKVISRASVMQYRGETVKTMKIIGEELGVNNLLEGGVQRAGDRIRINVKLSDAAADEHLWAESYDRELTVDNIFEIQEEISMRIANSLQAALSPGEQERIADRPTQSLGAYEAYLIGRQRFEMRTPNDVDEAINYFDLAIAEDPNFAQAYASKAEAILVQYGNGYFSLEEVLTSAKPLVEKARNINQELGIVYNVMGGIAEYSSDIPLAARYYRKAIELSPGYSTSYIWLGGIHRTFTGDYDEALRLFAMARELNPAAPLPKQNYVWQLDADGRTEEALEILRKMLRDDPNRPVPYAFAAEITAHSYGRFAQAMKLFQVARGAADPDGQDGSLALYFCQLGDFESAQVWYDSFVQNFADTGYEEEVRLKFIQANGNLQEAAALATKMLRHARDVFDLPEALRTIRDHSITIGDESAAVERYREFYPELFLTSPDVHRANISAAVDLVLLLMKIDRKEEASQLARAALEIMGSMPRMATSGLGLLDVELHAILGNRDEAIEALTAANNAGLVKYVDPEGFYPNLAGIAGDPEFQRLIGLIQERVAAEIQKIREMERDGQLARTPADIPNIVFDASF